ncbi:MAG: alpha/beta fold hydrolase [Syntrophobacteraceae bacterium]|jgi:pimeloyl-ACP methyl ester carboxylesterase
MGDLPPIDYSVLDRPEISLRIFHPRPEMRSFANTSASDISIPVGDQIAIGARFHVTNKEAPNILFSHGNGEITADYDDIGPIFNRMGINFLPVDYRGYGRSGGEPTVSSMMRDCHTIYDFTRKWLSDNGYTGPFIVMGRSLGSASALELASAHEDKIDGLIIESGFALAEPLLKLLGVDLRSLNFTESNGFRNIDKIKQFCKPVLIIHAEFDHIIPYSDALQFFRASPSPDKTLLKIPGANHNDIFFRGLREYMSAIQLFLGRLRF